MMELGLTLGDTARKPLKFLDESQNMVTKDTSTTTLGFCLGLDPLFSSNHRVGGERISGSSEEGESWRKEEIRRGSSDPTVQLDLLPFSPLPRTGTTKPSQLRFPWMQPPNLISEAGKGADMNRQPSVVVVVPDEDTEDGAALSSPNSTVSSFQMEYGIYRSGRSNNKRDFEGNNEGERIERASSRGSDEDENGLLARKKLRLTKDQSAFLEESFREHNTLNPKQKLALAKQLNLRPRQVEVWFQNRRARTKLKQTEVDCEYLKRCCETLTEENRRLQKELQELRALKSSKPFYMQLPATTLTMCPSCERVASSTATAASNAATAPPPAPEVTTTSTKPKLHPFLQDQVHALQAS